MDLIEAADRCRNTWISEVKALAREEDRNWLRGNSIVVTVGKEPLWINTS